MIIENQESLGVDNASTSDLLLWLGLARTLAALLRDALVRPSYDGLICFMS